MTNRLVRKDNPDIAIVGTLERLTGVARVGSAARVGDRLELHYAGGTDVDWDNQVTVYNAAGRVFVGLPQGVTTSQLLPSFRPTALTSQFGHFE